jgi:hypothetical protein
VKRAYGLLGLFFLLSNAHASDSGDLQIYHVNDADLTPVIRNCLQKHSMPQCLRTQLKTVTSDGDPNTEQLDSAWADFLHSAIGNSKIFSDDRIAAAFGFDYGMSRLDPDEVYFDPNMHATDAKLGDQAVWVMHSLELAPGAYAGTEAAPIGTNDLSKSYYGGIFQAGGIIRLIKRHPFDKTYSNNFWGTIGREKDILEQAIPDYIKVPTELAGSGLLPGEGIQFEGFFLVEIGLGPTYSLGTTPAIPYLGAGLFGSAGFIASTVLGHFSTKMEVQQDQTLRVILERINQDTEKLDAQLNAGFVIGPFSFVKNLFNLELGVTHTRETLFDMAFDPTYPEAKHALKEAYFGRFKEAQALAAQSVYKGVKEVGHSTDKERTTDRGISFLAWGKSSSESQITVNSQFPNPNSNELETPDDQTQMNEVDSYASGFGKSRDLQISIRNDVPAAGQTAPVRSLSFKYNFKSSKPSQSEVQQFLDMASVFGKTPDQAPVIGKPIQGYFFLDLDTENLKSIFSRPADFIALDLEAAAAKMPGGKDHLDEIKTFANALVKALQTSGTPSQDQVLVQTLRGKDFDLYPLGALALMVDGSHSLALERATYTTVTSDQDTLNLAAVGSAYEFPSRIEY